MNAWRGRKALLIVGLGLLPLFLLSLLLRDFARQAIAEPMARLFWLAGILYRSTPQVICWGMLLFTAFMLAVKSLRLPRSSVRQPAESAEPEFSRRERVSFWILQIYLSRWGYSRLRFADQFSRLILDVLAFREQLPSIEVEKQLENRQIELPSSAWIFLQARRAPFQAGAARLWRRLDMALHRLAQFASGGDGTENARSPRAFPVDPDLEDAVKYLEEQMEIGDEFNSRDRLTS